MSPEHPRISFPGRMFVNTCSTYFIIVLFNICRCVSGEIFLCISPKSKVQVSDTVIATLSDTQHRKGFKILNEMMMYVQLYIVHHTMKYDECCEKEINCTPIVQTRAYAAF